MLALADWLQEHREEIENLNRKAEERRESERTPEALKASRVRMAKRSLERLERSDLIAQLES